MWRELDYVGMVMTTAVVNAAIPTFAAVLIAEW